MVELEELNVFTDTASKVYLSELHANVGWTLWLMLLHIFLRVNVRRDEDLIPELNMNYDSQCDIMFFSLLFYAFTFLFNMYRLLFTVILSRLTSCN